MSDLALATGATGALQRRTPGLERVEASRTRRYFFNTIALPVVRPGRLERGSAFPGSRATT